MKHFFSCCFLFLRRHACFFCCVIAGCCAGVFGAVAGIITGVILEKIIIRFLEERHLLKVLEEGKNVQIKGEPFAGAFFVSALTVFCLNDIENSVYQLKTFFGNKGDWLLYCRVAGSCRGINGDLLVECLSSAIKKSEGKAVPLQEIFRLLSAVEFLWNENERGERPSKYLASLLDYNYISDEIAGAYRVLGLNPGDSLEKVKAAHRKLAAKFHPDVSLSEDSQSSLSSFVRIQTAYETILHQLS